MIRQNAEKGMDTRQRVEGDELGDLRVAARKML